MRRALCAVVLVATLIGVAAPAHAYHGGRRVTTATEAPYTVLIDARTFKTQFLCSGSIIDPAHIVTAAHCTTDDHDRRLRASAFTIAAGITARREGLAPGVQLRRVTAIRVHPAYDARVNGYADVAVLQVDPPLQTTPTVAPVPIVQSGATPVAGTVVRGYGFGMDRRDDEGTDEHALDMTVRPFQRCLPGIGGVTCARSAVGTGCPGDSGGPIVTTGAAVVLTGVISGGSDNRCAAGETAWFADLASPGIGDFVRGSDDPPAMPHADELATLRLTSGEETPIRCDPAPWRDAASTTTLFVHAASDQTVQDSPATTYVPQPADVGQRIACRSIGQSAGGTAWMPAGATILVQAGRSAGAYRLCLQATDRPRPRCREWTPSAPTA